MTNMKAMRDGEMVCNVAEYRRLLNVEREAVALRSELTGLQTRIAELEAELA